MIEAILQAALLLLIAGAFCVIAAAFVLSFFPWPDNEHDPF